MGLDFNSALVVCCYEGVVFSINYCISYCLLHCNQKIVATLAGLKSEVLLKCSNIKTMSSNEVGDTVIWDLQMPHCPVNFNRDLNRFSNPNKTRAWKLLIS